MAAPVKPERLTDCLRASSAGLGRQALCRYNIWNVSPLAGYASALFALMSRKLIRKMVWTPACRNAFGTQAGHRFVVALRLIDDTAYVIAVCRSCSVVNIPKELCIPLLRNASGEFYLLDSFLFKMVRTHEIIQSKSKYD
jgi:hypothetical protein